MSDDTPTPEDAATRTRGAAPYELSDYEKDALGEIGNICMSSAAGVLATLLDRTVQITTPTVELLTTPLCAPSSTRRRPWSRSPTPRDSRAAASSCSPSPTPRSWPT